MTSGRHDDLGTAPRIDGRTTRFQHRRSELLDQLTEYFLDHGIADLSLRPAATAIGVTHATLIRQFTSKDQLIAEVVERILSDLLAILDIDRPLGANGSVTSWLRDIWSRLTEPAEIRQFFLLFELAARIGRTPDPQSSISTTLAVDLVVPLQRQLEERFELPPRKAELIAVLITAQTRGLVVELITSTDRTRADAAMDEFIEMIGEHLEEA